MPKNVEYIVRIFDPYMSVMERVFTAPHFSEMAEFLEHAFRHFGRHAVKIYFHEEVDPEEVYVIVKQAVTTGLTPEEVAVLLLTPPRN